MRLLAPIALCLVTAIALTASCRAPTEVTMVITTDVKCADLRGTSVTVGRLGELEAKAGTTSSTACDASGQLGTLVIVPSGDDNEEVAVRIIAGLGRDPESCVPPYGKGCIVARRAIRFLPHTPLRVTVPLRVVCDGVPCGETQTCVGGACVGAIIPDPAQCTGDGCSETTLISSSSPVDASTPVDATPAPPPDAAPDAAPDASVPEVGAPDAGLAVIGIASGVGASCALLATGGVKCWGGNTNGQLGDGTTTPHLAPADVIALGGPVTQISLSTSNSYACALMATGGVKCWGNNTSGQLGDGTFTQRPAPVDVVSLGGVATQVSVGFDFSCALLKTGGIRCWGGNATAQLGNGGGASSAMPVDVASLGGTAVQVAAGDTYACAILSTGAVRCWGANGGGQLGDGTNTPRTVPTDVATLGGTATDISATFDSHTCAVLSTGVLRCWGNGTSGQLGNGGVLSSNLPVTVSALGGVATRVRVSVDNTCALLADGSVRCWGRNSAGQNGDGTTLQNALPAAVVSLGGTAIDLTAGSADACALLSSGVARCWGANGGGQLGDGTTTGSSVPVTVLGLP